MIPFEKRYPKRWTVFKMIRKLGNFFLLAGILSLIIFAAEPSREEGTLVLCFGGTSLFLLGLLILRRGRRRRSGRFRLIRRNFGGRRDQEEEDGR